MSIIERMGLAAHLAAQADLARTAGLPEAERIAGAVGSGVGAALALLLLEDETGSVLCPQCEEPVDGVCLCGLDGRYRAPVKR